MCMSMAFSLSTGSQGAFSDIQDKMKQKGPQSLNSPLNWNASPNLCRSLYLFFFTLNEYNQCKRVNCHTRTCVRIATFTDIIVCHTLDFHECTMHLKRNMLSNT